MELERWDTSCLYFECMECLSFSLSWGENSTRDHKLWKIWCRLLTCRVPRPLTQHFIQEKSQEFFFSVCSWDKEIFLTVERILSVLMFWK